MEIKQDVAPENTSPIKMHKSQPHHLMDHDDMEDLPYLEMLNFRATRLGPGLRRELNTPVGGTSRPVGRDFGIPKLAYTPSDHTGSTPSSVSSISSICEHERPEGSDLSTSSTCSTGESYSQSEDIFSLSEDFEEEEEEVGHRTQQREQGEQQWLLGPQSLIHEGRMTIVLDMDETLVHSEFLNGEDYNYRQEEDTRHTANNSGPDFFLDVCDGVAVHTRPWLCEFLETLAKHFEVGVFTAAEEVYAKPVLDTIDPNGAIAFRLYRDATVEHQGSQFVKDLSRLGRDLRRTVLVDNNVQATLASPDNSLMIEDYYGDRTDCELKRILSVLHRLNKMDDVRPLLRSRYNNQDYEWEWEWEEMSNIDSEWL